MNDAERTLVIILSVALAILLVLSIITVIRLIQLLSTLRRVAEKAEHVADIAESISDKLPRAFGSFAVGKIIGKVLRTMKNNSSKGKRGK